VRGLIVAAVLSLAWATLPAAAQTLDANGKCHGPDGKLARAELCAKAQKPVRMKCRDVRTGHAAKCGAANAEPVPADN
jgi:hypothetical protein